MGGTPVSIEPVEAEGKMPSGQPAGRQRYGEPPANMLD